MSKNTTLIFLTFCLGLIGFQQPLFAIDETSLIFNCPNHELLCVEDGIGVAPADDFFGQEFELATKVSFEGPLSKIEFLGVILPYYLPHKSSSSPVADFRVKIYESGTNGPGELKSSFEFDNTEADDFIAINDDEVERFGLKAVKRADNDTYLCIYKLELPVPVSINGEAYISITRVNNFSPRKDSEVTNVFRILGITEDDFEGFGGSYYKNFAFDEIVKKDNNWQAMPPFTPALQLSGPAPVPLGSIAFYIGMLLIAGFSVFSTRRKSS